MPHTQAESHRSQRKQRYHRSTQLKDDAMKRISIKYRKSSSGQVLAEYVIMLVLLAVIALSCLVLFSVFSDYGIDIRRQVSIDMP